MAGRWGKERIPQRQPWRIGVHLREGRRGRTGADAATLLHAGAPGFTFSSGEIWAVHVGWSGNHTHYAERMAPPANRSSAAASCCFPVRSCWARARRTPHPGSTGPTASASTRSPTGSTATSGRGPATRRPRDRSPSTSGRRSTSITISAGWSSSPRQPPRSGIERYVLDDGWFGQRRRDDRAGLGDWTVSPDVWPDGLHPLVDTVKELGMEFGLWFEPEMINLDSDVARAHPEWIMAHRRPAAGRVPTPAGDQSRHRRSATPTSGTRSSRSWPSTRSTTSSGITTAI